MSSPSHPVPRGSRIERVDSNERDDTEQVKKEEELRARLTRLRAKHRWLSHAISQCEYGLACAGMEWFRLPEVIRRLLLRDPASHTLRAWFDDQAPIIDATHPLRCMLYLKDQMMTEIRNKQPKLAKMTFKTCSPMRADFFERIHAVVEEFHQFDDLFDNGLQPETIPETEDEMPEKYAQVKAWVLQLPEVQRAIESGFATEEEAYLMTIKPEETEEMLDYTDHESSDDEVGMGGENNATAEEEEDSQSSALTSSAQFLPPALAFR